MLTRLHSLATCLLLITGGVVCLSAQSQNSSAQTAPIEAYQSLTEKMADGELSTQEWALVLQLYSRPEGKAQVVEAVHGLEEFPRKILVSLLTHEKLAVRLSALDLVEDAAGVSYVYDPWLTLDETHLNEPGLAKWQAWAEGDSALTQQSATLEQEQATRLLTALLSGQEQKSLRARRQMQEYGLQGLSYLQNYLQENPEIPDGQRAKLKETQYYLVLIRADRKRATSLSRDLTFGNRDQVLNALSQLKKTGFTSIPIIRDYIDSGDPLVRETAIDALLSVGQAQVLPLAIPVLEKEVDLNVIHSAIRQLKSIKTPEARQIIQQYSQHEDEDLLIAALDALQVNKRERSSSFFSKRRNMGQEGVLKLPLKQHLDDPRWRVRVAALENITKTQQKGYDNEIIELLQDEEEFVRAKAVEAVKSLSIRGATKELRKMVLDDPEMAGSVFAAYGQLGKSPDEKMVKAVEQSDPNHIVSAIQGMQDMSDEVELLIRFSRHESLDVSCIALQMLAKKGELHDDKIATVLLDALNSESAQHRQTVLDYIKLPENTDRIRTSSSYAKILNERSSSKQQSKLDSIYEAFRKTYEEGDQDAEGATSVQVRTRAGAQGEFIEYLYELTQGGGEEAFRSSLVLFQAGDSRASAALLANYDSYDSSQKAAIAGAVYKPMDGSLAAHKIYSQLLQDPVQTIRKEAAGVCLSTSGHESFVETAISVMDVPESKLHPVDIYGYSLENCMSEYNYREPLVNWARAYASTDDLQNQQRRDERLVLALVILTPAHGGDGLLEIVLPHLESDSQWVRRAAYRLLFNVDQDEFNRRVEHLLADPSAKVRMVLPSVMTEISGSWTHYFSETKNAPDNQFRRSSSRNQRPTNELTEQITRALYTLTESDPSAEVRFEAGAALMSLDLNVEVDKLTPLISSLPKERNIDYHLGEYFAENASSISSDFRPLLGYANLDRIGEDKMAMIIKRFSGSKGLNVLSFQELANPDTDIAPDGTLVVQTPREVYSHDLIELIYFHKVGCKKCARTEEFLDLLKRDYPQLKVIKHRLTKQLPLNQALCNSFDIATKDHRKAPSVFSQAGGLVDGEITPSNLSNLLADTLSQPPNADWYDFGTASLAGAEQDVDREFSNLTFWLVLGAGLLDGINPCAFATIIFLLSYLQVAKRSPGEILLVGGAFILAVFVSYLAVGLVLHQALHRIMAPFIAIRPLFTIIFAGLAFLVSYLSFRDALRARKGNLSEMTLQLPSFLKDRIRGVIRRGARARNFVLAAFVSGVFISFLELACTGQVYAPIIYKIQQNELNAYFYLLLYNLAFIAPLVLIFILAYRGMTSEALIAFQKRHTTKVKIALALLFLILGIVLLLS